jgi:FlaA1/EpsC-like NDP-sugar epimerase
MDGLIVHRAVERPPYFALASASLVVLPEGDLLLALAFALCRYTRPNAILGGTTTMPSPSAANGPHDHEHEHHDPLDSLWHRLTGLSPSVAHTPRKSLTDKRILVTGAGGSIGSALARNIAASNPASLILLDSAEHSLYQIDRALAGTRHTAIPHTAILGSVTDRPLLAELFRQHRPQIIVHAAAFKHVPLIEQNPFAAIANNALGTYALAQSALLHRAEHLLLVSTDKAVDPHSLMGASKRIAELTILALAHSGGVATNATNTTKMTALRLGNVLGSHGSVVPLFLDQIARGGPITVTHPEARRYFLTLDQTVTALLDALETPATLETPAALETSDALDAPAVPGTGTILIPDLAPPIRILDLARHLRQRHASAAEIVFTGLRPGDKLEESLLSSRESIPESIREFPRGSGRDSSRARLRSVEVPANSAPTLAALEAAMLALDHALQQRDLAAALRTVLHLVPEYTPSAQLASAIPPIQSPVKAQTEEAHA